MHVYDAKRGWRIRKHEVNSNTLKAFIHRAARIENIILAFNKQRKKKEWNDIQFYIKCLVLQREICVIIACNLIIVPNALRQTVHCNVAARQHTSFTAGGSPLGFRFSAQ